MKKYEDFMKIELSKKEAINVFTGIGFKYYKLENLMPYSKIVIQFNNEYDVDRFENDEPDFNTYVFSSSLSGNLQYILYTCDNNAFNDVCNICAIYDCDVYQFIIKNEVDVNNFFEV